MTFGDQSAHEFGLSGYCPGGSPRTLWRPFRLLYATVERFCTACQLLLSRLWPLPKLSLLGADSPLNFDHSHIRQIGCDLAAVRLWRIRESLDQFLKRMRQANPIYTGGGV